MEAFIRGEGGSAGTAEHANLEDKAVSQVGRALYQAFIKGYTQKQWNKDPRELPALIITRLPVRNNYCTDYFDDPWQGLPLEGYHALFDKLLRHENIRLFLCTEFQEMAPSLPAECPIFYSGALDEFFEYRLGCLEWRSLRFEKETLPYPDYQGAAVINQGDACVPYTRTHEFRHLHPERTYPHLFQTVIVREYPQDFVPGAERYYPVNSPRNQELLRRYQELAAARAPRVVFGGRLGGYRYLDMDAVVLEALERADEYLGVSA